MRRDTGAFEEFVVAVIAGFTIVVSVLSIACIVSWF